MTNVLFGASTVIVHSSSKNIWVIMKQFWPKDSLKEFGDA